MVKIIILLIIASVCFADFPPDWGYDYYALSLRVGSAMKDSTKTDGWAYIDSLQVNWANFATATFESIEADTATINDVISAGSAYMNLDSLDVDHINLGVNLLGSTAYADLDSLESDHITGADIEMTDATFTSLNTDSVRSDYISSVGATSYLSMAGDTLMVTRVGAVGIYNQILCFKNEGGVKRCFGWNDQYSVWSFGNDVSVTGGLSLSGIFSTAGNLVAAGYLLSGTSSNNVKLNVVGTSGVLSTAGTVVNILQDANSTGSGTTQIGETGDADLTNMNSQLYYTPNTIAADDVTPSVAGGNVFTTSVNTGATAITDLDDPIAGQIVYLIGGSNTNSSTIADGGNFNLSAGWTANEDDVLVLYVVADNNYIELSRTDN